MTTAALVFAAGDLPPKAVTNAVVLRGLGRASYVVAADGGLVHARALGIEPHKIVGDLDSVPGGLLTSYPSHLVARHPTTKDELDLELALSAAVEEGARELSVLGAFGDRLDQSLAAIMIAARLARDGLRLDLHGGRHSAWPVAAGQTVGLDLTVGTTVSVVALTDDAVVSGTGLAYRLEGLHLPFGAGLGVSNRQAEPAASIACLAGVVAVIAEHGAPS